MLNKTKLSIGLLAAGSALLAACGGGSSGPTITGAKPEGVYRLVSSTGNVDVLMLESNDAWIITSTQLAAGPILSTVFSAKSGSSNGSKYSSGDMTSYAPASTVVNGSLNGSLNGDYVAGTSFTAVVATGIGASTFAATSPPAAVFNYNTPVDFAKITGDWTAMTLGTDSGTLTITADSADSAGAALTGVFDGCTISGQIKQRASNKNVFDVDMSYPSNSSCAKSGQSFKGHALSYTVEVPTTAAGTTLVSKNQLIIVGTTADRASAEAFIAQKDVEVP